MKYAASSSGVVGYGRGRVRLESVLGASIPLTP